MTKENNKSLLCKICRLFLLVSMVTSEGFKDEIEDQSNSRSLFFKPSQPVKLSKFSLTQKGYIQFLRYVTEVPPIGDFTFCIWMKSINLTYSHPLLSYSQHESERLIRAWVTPGGDEIRLAVKEYDIIKEPVGFKENQWYHICQSWSTKTGHWDLFLNGKLKAHGYNKRVQGQILPKGGDIVVGQEYTDFDKGLDDGIEGDIFGFNMILASTSSNQKPFNFPEKPVFYSGRFPRPQKLKGHYIVHRSPVYLKRQGKILDQDEHESSVTEVEISTEEVTAAESKIDEDDSTLVRSRRQSYHFPYLGYLPIIPQMKPIIPYIYPNTQYAYRSQPSYLPDTLAPPVPTTKNKINRIANFVPPYNQKPLGLQLVELSYDCSKGRGAPLSGKEVLISWTRTPVRVFGGAILKKVEPFCYRSPRQR